MSMPGVGMIVRMAGMSVTVIMAMVVGMPGHAPILPVRKLGRLSVVGQLNFDFLCHDQENSN